MKWSLFIKSNQGKSCILPWFMTTLLLLGKIYSGYGQIINDCSALIQDSVINSDRIGAVAIGDSIDFVTRTYDFIQVGDMYEISCDSKLFMKVWSRNDTLISGVEVFDKSYRTVEGIHVGMTVKELLSIFPEQEMGYNEYGEEYLVVDKYTTDKNRILLAYISSEKQLGNYDLGLETYDYEIEGKIVRIELFNWK